MKAKYPGCRRSLFGIGVSLLAAAPAFAAANECRNPVEVALTGAVRMKFCEIPAGSAAIGSANGESDEKPVTRRNFKGFQLGRYPVTQRQYKAVLGEEPWKENGKVKSLVRLGDDASAVYISWVQASEFARAMSRVDPSASYRLPTEAEFEYAARAGTTTNYYWGDKKAPGSCRLRQGGGDAQRAHGGALSCPELVCGKKHPDGCANGFGLMHMLGDVWQWTADAYVNGYAGAPVDGNVAVAGDAGANRVIRGGSRLSGPQRSSHRSAGAPINRGSGVGFRLVRIPR